MNDFRVGRTWITQDGKSVRLDQIVRVTVGERGLGYLTPEQPEPYYLEFGAPKVITFTTYYMKREEAERDALRVRVAVDRVLHGERKDEARAVEADQ